MKIFGFTLGKKDVTQVESPDEKSFALPTAALDDGAVTVTQNAYYGTYVDLEGSVRNELELITRYREMSNHPELESAIDDIVNEAITHSGDGSVVEINVDNLKQPDSIKKKIIEEYDYVLKLLNFSNLADDLFRRWYIDGRIYFHVVVNEKNPKEGIQELRYIDPRKIRKIREINKERDPVTGANIIKSMAEYYIYNDKGTSTQTYTAGGVNNGIRVATDSIININSGLMDAKNNFVISPLHSCIGSHERVRTIDGWKFIKDITKGDTIFSYDQNSDKLIPTKVVDCWSNGIKNVVTIKCRHTTLKCTEDHLLLTRHNKTNIIEYLPINKIKPKIHQIRLPYTNEFYEEIPFPKTNRKLVFKVSNPELWVNATIKGKKKIIYAIADEIGMRRSRVYGFVYGYQPLYEEEANNIIERLPIKLELSSKIEGYCLNQVNIPEYVNEDFAELFGFLIGDGWINPYAVGFAEGVYPELNERYKFLMEHFFGNCRRVVNKGRNSNYHSYYSSTTLGGELLKQLGFITGCKNKRIPDWVFKSKRSVKLAFIQGLHNADGCNRDHLFGGYFASTFNLSNQNLIYDIKELWTTLGLSSGKIYFGKSPGQREIAGKMRNISDHWSVTISARPLPEFENIFEISNVGESDEVFDLEVENENHNFIVNGLVAHNCIKPLNQLRMIEDAIVVYRISRSPERRVFYIDVGNLPKGKAEQYLRDVMVKYRNKMTYDASTGSVVDSRKHLSMLEDFFLPRREGCLIFTTKIKLLDGRDVTLEQLITEYTLEQLITEYKIGKQNWVYSVSPTGEIVPGKITWAGVTRLNADVLDVHLDNGEVITVTPDHKFILRNGEKVEAKDLQIGSSLMPLYTRKQKITYNRGAEYLQVYDNEQNKWKFVHRIVAEYIHGPRGKKEVIHHKDFTKNNNPDNLVYMNKKEHYLYHCQNASLSWAIGDKEEHKKNLSIAGKKFFETEDGLKRRQEISEFNKTSPKIQEGFKKGRETIKENRKLDKETMTHEEYLAKWSPGLSKMGLSGTIAAQKKAQWERENLSNEEWKKKCKKKGEYRRQQYAEFTSKISLETVTNIIKDEVIKNINVSNATLVNIVQEIYPELNLRKLRNYLSCVGGYASISDLIHRNVGIDYLNKKRLYQINPEIRNHKVVKIVPGTPQNVGTLTIDEHHEYHDYHNFGLSAGIFVMNSRGTEITTLPAGAALNDLPDLEYFKKKLLQSLHVPYFTCTIF